MSVEVALEAYVIPDDHRIYKFFPGKAYKFFDAISDEAVAFLDIRRLSALGPLRKWTDDSLLLHIANDRVQRTVDAGGDRPSRLVRSVGDKRNLGFLKTLIFEARKGDFIMMPTKEFSDPVMVGELLDDPKTVKPVKTRDQAFSGTYYGRRVKWLNPIPKKMIDARLIKILHSPTTIHEINDRYYEGIYKLALDNYVRDSLFVSTFRTSKKIFTSKDNLLTSLWFELMEVVEEASESKHRLKLKSIYELAVQSDISEDERNDLSIYIQSPGWFKLTSSASAPFVALALFVMASSSMPYEEALSATVTAHVVQDADTSCLGIVDESVREYLEILGKERWEESCRLAEKAANDATLKADGALRTSKKSVRHRS